MRLECGKEEDLPEMLQRLRSMEALQELTFVMTCLFDVALLAPCLPLSLTKLRLQAPKLLHVAALARLTNIQQVCLWGNIVAVEDLSFLRKMELLTSLELSGFDNLEMTGLRFFKFIHHPSLKSLSLRNAPNLQSLWGIKKYLPSLTSLHLEHLPLVGKPELVALESVCLKSRSIHCASLLKAQKKKFLLKRE